ncbi:MAG: nucleotidyl transferase AbiEii/AbiGii toxin family protein [Myxococcota bacterium]
MNEDFRDILASLLDQGAEFVVVGAHALAIHGAARATGDIDLLVRPTAANAARVASALRAFGAPLGTHGVSQEDFAVEGTIYQLGLPPRRIDVLTRIDGVSFDEAWSGRATRTIDAMAVPFLGRAELVRNKRAAGRPKDLADLALLDEAAAGDPAVERE